MEDESPIRVVDRLAGVEQGAESGGAEETDLLHVEDDL
jgi:hypothetical protein